SGALTMTPGDQLIYGEPPRALPDPACPQPDAGQPLADPAAGPDGDAFSPPEDITARWGRWAAQVLVVGLVLLMGAEMVVRSAFGWSIQFSNELGGYALVAITFLSLASG